MFNGSRIEALKAKLQMLHMRNLFRNIHLWEMNRRRGCKDMGRRTDQWVQQRSTTSLQGEKSRCGNILRGPTFQSTYDCFCYRIILCSCPHLSKDCKIAANLLAEILKQRPGVQTAYIACDAALGPELSCCGFGLILLCPSPFQMEQGEPCWSLLVINC